MFDESPGGANLGGRSVTMFEDALIIIKSHGVVCAGQIENNNKLLTVVREYVPPTRGQTPRYRFNDLPNLRPFRFLIERSRLCPNSEFV